MHQRGENGKLLRLGCQKALERLLDNQKRFLEIRDYKTAKPRNGEITEEAEIENRNKEER